MHDSSDRQVLHGLDISHARICAEQRNLFVLIAEADRRGLWSSDGARDMAHWLWMRYGVSDWKGAPLDRCGPGAGISSTVVTGIRIG
jgi:hypothetical protein